MKIGFFTDDFINISSHPGKSSGIYVFDIKKKRTTGEEKILFKEADFSNDVKFKNCRGKLNGRCRFSFTNGFIEINEELKKLKIKDLFYGCKVIFCRAIGYNLEQKLLKSGIKLFITAETDIQKALNMYIIGSLKNYYNCAI